MELILNVDFAGGSGLQSFHDKRVAHKVFSINDLRLDKSAISAAMQTKEASVDAGLLLISLLLLFYTLGGNYHANWFSEASCWWDMN
jgi:hypothetical protein